MGQLHKVTVTFRPVGWQQTIKTIVFEKAHTVTFEPGRRLCVESDDGMLWLNLEMGFQHENAELVSFESVPLHVLADKGEADRTIEHLTRIEHLMRNGQKIQAIKHARTVFGYNLKQAKDYVEENFGEVYNVPPVDYDDIPY